MLGVEVGGGAIEDAPHILPPHLLISGRQLSGIRAQAWVSEAGRQAWGYGSKRQSWRTKAALIPQHWNPLYSILTCLLSLFLSLSLSLSTSNCKPESSTILKQAISSSHNKPEREWECKRRNVFCFTRVMCWSVGVTVGSNSFIFSGGSLSCLTWQKRINSPASMNAWVKKKLFTT